jgi:hypothetical protein
LTTQTLIGRYAEVLKQNTDLPLPDKTAAILAREIEKLRKNKIPEAAILAGIELLAERGRPPSILTELVIEAATQKRKTGSVTQGNEVCPICSLKFKSLVRLQDHLENVHHTNAPTADAPSPGLF